MAEQSFDVVVIGAGPGGYVCAIRAAQLGMKTACIEKRPTLGGTCLNIGCIPSKALLQSSEMYHLAQHRLALHGVVVALPALNLAAMHGHKNQVVKANTAGVEFLFKKHNIAWLKGAARLAGPGRLIVTGANGVAETIAARHIVIATGSESTPLANVAVDEKQILSSTGGLALTGVPKTVAVIGAGYIGLELGTVWRRLGAQVTVIEFLDRILPGMDAELANEMHRLLGKQGLRFKLSTKVTSATASRVGVKLTLAPTAGGPEETLDTEIVLVAVGRRAYTEGLGLAEAGVAQDDKGRVKTNARFATNVAGLYAIGDVVAGPMLAHKAEDEGMALAETLAGQKPHVNYDAIPGVVYTWPEAATVGKSEEELKAAGVAYRVGKFPFTANGRARAMAMTDGFVKILADATTDRVLGCHIVGPEAGNLIHELVLAMEFGASAEDVARTCHAHPTLNEAVREAALAVDKRAIHI